MDQRLSPALPPASDGGQMENGHRIPTLDKIHELATALGVDPHDLNARLASTRKGRR